MKKTNLVLTLALLATTAVSTLTSCSESKTNTLTIYLPEEYIDEGVDDLGNKVGNSVCEDFEAYYLKQTGEKISVDLETFSTLEDMYNQISIGAISPDIVCPSEYMLMRMENEGLLAHFGYDTTKKEYTSGMDNYNKYASPYIKDLFHRNNLSDFAVPYMWGTMGYIYNPNYVSDDLVSTWDAQWNPTLKGKITIKDSMRDTYFTSVMHVYKDELNTLKTQYENNEIDSTTYNNKLSEIFNRVDDETLSKCLAALKECKKNIYGMEVDDGRGEIVKGTYWASLFWSGEAIYSMDNAEESGTKLKYSVPEEGSNIWFDGWAMMKDANIDASKMFIDFCSRPDIAVRNMDYTGYTSAIAGQEVYDYILETRAAEENETDVVERDISYYFEGTLDNDGKAIVKIPADEVGRQFDTQYPSEEIITRCAIMKDFGDRTSALNNMWSSFKAA